MQWGMFSSVSGLQPCLCSGAVTEEVAYTPHVYFSQFWRLENPDQGATGSTVEFLGKGPFPGLDIPVFLLQPDVVERASKS